MKNNILVVVAHPDDEILGIGGTILKHIDQGDSVSILILSSGEDSRGDHISNNKKRIQQAMEVAQRLNCKLSMENLPDNKFDSVPLLDIVKVVEKYISDLSPNTIYTHFSHDLNVDHRLTFQAIMTACRPQPNFCVRNIFCFETNSSTEWQKKDSSMIFCPHKYVDISAYIDEKLEILSLYKDEIRDFPHPRSLHGVRVLSEFRGMEVGYSYAEAFEVIRILD